MKNICHNFYRKIIFNASALCNGTINLKKRENTKDTKLISKKQEKETRK